MGRADVATENRSVSTPAAREYPYGHCDCTADNGGHQYDRDRAGQLMPDGRGSYGGDHAYGTTRSLWSEGST
jgi:hypothetical protein